MKKINVFLLFSLILTAVGYRGFDEFILLRRGNKLSIGRHYTEADSTFKKTVTKYDSKAAKSNSIVNLYEGMLYRELLDTTNGGHFHRGNSEVYLAEKEQNPESQIEGYELALDEYRLAMKGSDDINIKRNYEIIAMRIEKIEKQQQQNQENQNPDEKDNQKQDNSKTSDQEKNQSDNKQQNNQDKNKDSDEGQQNTDNKQDQTGKNSGQEQEQNDNKSKGNPESREQISSTEIKEALATLERLENSEEQAFKNNERLEYLGGDTDESW